MVPKERRENQWMVDIAHLLGDNAGVRSKAPAPLPIIRSRLVGDLLALLATHPDRWWTIAEVASHTGGAYTTVTREVRRLEEAGIVEAEEMGRSKRVHLNAGNPLYRPLSELMLRAFGPVVVVREEFDGIPGVERVCIFGSWAARYEGEPGASPNDIDVLVLGDPDRDRVHAAARGAEKRIGLPVNTTVRRVEDWEHADDAFARAVKGSSLVTAMRHSEES